MMDFIRSLFLDWSRYVPSWVLGIALAIVGWGFAVVSRSITATILRWLRFDKLGEKTGLASFLRKGQVSFAPSQLVGFAVYWIILLGTFLLVAVLLDIAVATELWNGVVRSIPSFLSAAFVLALGWAIVAFLSNFTLTIARNASWGHASTLAAAVKIFGGILVVAVAAEQINLRISIFNSLVVVVTAAVSLGFALAFGLGCQDIARDAFKRFVKNWREKNNLGKGPDLEG